jgi:RES domain-containing protein
VLVYRIARSIFPTLDGEGARIVGGRWNSVGLPMVYTSATASLAALELLVHVSRSTTPTDLELATVEIPDDLTITSVDARQLPVDWSTLEQVPACRHVGDTWLVGAEASVLRVPAAPIVSEFNYLINPRHTAAVRIRVIDRRPFAFDARLMK